MNHSTLGGELCSLPSQIFETVGCPRTDLKGGGEGQGASVVLNHVQYSWR